MLREVATGKADSRSAACETLKGVTPRSVSPTSCLENEDDRTTSEKGILTGHIS